MASETNIQESNLKFPYQALTFLINLILLIITLPFFIVIPLLIKISGRGPIFYQGVRLGLNKRPFFIYKFRTLEEGAQQKLGASLLPGRNNLVTPVGNFLRESKLDELPQLINVLKGDMNLIGPRPLRPEIYEKFCKCIPDYDKQFLVKPGVLCITQLFATHSTPKRIQSMLDRIYYNRKWTPKDELLLLVKAIWSLARNGLKVSWRDMINWVKILLSNAPLKNQRGLPRAEFENAYAFVRSLKINSDIEEIKCSLIDANEESVHINSIQDLPNRDIYLRLERSLPPKRGLTPRRKIALCIGKMSISKPRNPWGYLDYVIDIEPITPLNKLKYEKYFLMKTIC